MFIEGWPRGRGSFTNHLNSGRCQQLSVAPQVERVWLNEQAAVLWGIGSDSRTTTSGAAAGPGPAAYEVTVELVTGRTHQVRRYEATGSSHGGYGFPWVRCVPLLSVRRLHLVLWVWRCAGAGADGGHRLSAAG